MRGSFLASCVPELQMHSLTSAIRCLIYHSFLLEINPNSGYESRVKSTIGILIEEARFPNAGVPERQELYQVIVIHLGKNLV